MKIVLKNEIHIYRRIYVRFTARKLNYEMSITIIGSKTPMMICELHIPDKKQ